MFDDLMDDTRNSNVEVGSLLSHGDGEAMVHACEESEWRLE